MYAKLSIRHLLPRLIAAIFILLSTVQPNPVLADGPQIRVSLLQDRICGMGWTAGSNITMTVGSLTKQALTQEGICYGGTGPDFFLGSELKLEPGMLVTMTDGITARAYIIRELTITDTQADPSNRVFGKTDHLGEITIFADNDTTGAMRTVTADAQGNWVADFGTPGPNQGEEITIALDDRIRGLARAADADGDDTWEMWQVQRKGIEAHFHPVNSDKNDYLVALDWPEGANLVATIDDPATPASPDYTLEQQAAYNENYGSAIAIIEGAFTLKAGDVVRVHDALTLREMTVAKLSAIANPVTDQVTGDAAPNQDVFVWVAISTGWVTRSVTASPLGSYVADFSVAEAGNPDGGVYDIVPGLAGEASVDTPPGQTRADWQLFNPNLVAVPSIDRVFSLGDWGGAQATLIIDDSPLPNAGPWLYSNGQPNQPSDCGFPCFNLAGSFDLQPGQYVSLSDGYQTKTLRVTSLHITQVDYLHDRLLGTASPNALVRVEVESQGAARSITANAQGNWVADFSVPGDEDFEQNLASLLLGDYGQALEPVPGSLYDRTLEFWSIDSYPLCSPGTSISGTVTKTSPWIYQNANRSAGNSVFFVDASLGKPVYQVAAGSNGSYGCQLPPATYKVYADTDGYMRDYHGGVNLAEATGLVVTAGSNTPGINLAFDTPWQGVEQITFNFAHSIPADLAVRKAIAYAIDRDSLDASYGPYAPVAESISSPGSPMYPNSGLTHYSFDPAYARTVLDAAGWIDTNADGVREKAGQRLHLVLVTFNRPDRQEAAGRIQADLAEVGIEVETQFYSGPQLVGGSGQLVKGNFDLGMFTWMSTDYTEYMGAVYRSDVQATSNWGKYTNPTADAMLQEADTQTTFAAKVPIYKAHQKILLSDLALLPLFWRVDYDADLDGQPDLIDPCPADAQDGCLLAASGALSFGTGGGSLVTPNGSLALAVPQGALAQRGVLSITGWGSGSFFSPSLGMLITAGRYQLEPGGLSFTVPVTLTFHWLDANDDGVVDGTHIAESKLMVAHDGAFITPPCASNPTCDASANQVSVQVNHLSLFVLGVQGSKLFLPAVRK
jgi:hypothetical protein